MNNFNYDILLTIPKPPSPNLSITRSLFRSISGIFCKKFNYDYNILKHQIFRFNLFLVYERMSIIFTFKSFSLFGKGPSLSEFNAFGVYTCWLKVTSRSSKSSTKLSWGLDIEFWYRSDASCIIIGEKELPKIEFLHLFSFQHKI